MIWPKTLSEMNALGTYFCGQIDGYQIPSPLSFCTSKQKVKMHEMNDMHRMNGMHFFLCF